MFGIFKSKQQKNYECAVNLFNNEQYKEANTYFMKYPNYKDSRLKIYIISKKTNMYSQLNPITFLNKLHHLPEVQAEIGLYYANMYDNQDAREWLTRAVDNNYKNVEVYVLLGKLVYYNKDTIKMNEDYNNLCDYRTRRLNNSYHYFNEAKKLGWIDKKNILLNMYGQQFMDNYYD